MFLVVQLKMLRASCFYFPLNQQKNVTQIPVVLQSSCWKATSTGSEKRVWFSLISRAEICYLVLLILCSRVVFITCKEWNAAPGVCVTLLCNFQGQRFIRFSCLLLPCSLLSMSYKGRILLAPLLLLWPQNGLTEALPSPAVTSASQTLNENFLPHKRCTREHFTELCGTELGLFGAQVEHCSSQNCFAWTLLSCRRNKQTKNGKKNLF